MFAQNMEKYRWHFDTLIGTKQKILENDIKLVMPLVLAANSCLQKWIIHLM